MAWDDRVQDLPGMVATADLSGKQFYFVKLDPATADQIVICSAASDRPLGVLQNKPKAGEAAQVRVAGVTKVSIGSAGLALADPNIPNATTLVGTDASGQAVAKNFTSTGADYGDWVRGETIEGGSSGELATMRLFGPDRIH